MLPYAKYFYIPAGPAFPPPRPLTVLSLSSTVSKQGSFIIEAFKALISGP
jgi:hypothetical protein